MNELHQDLHTSCFVVLSIHEIVKFCVCMYMLEDCVYSEDETRKQLTFSLSIFLAFECNL